MKKCVIADDSGIVRDKVKAFLQKHGYEVVGSAKNGQEAYELCLTHRPMIAVFDVSMPIMNGDVAGMKVKQEGLANFVVIASSQTQIATLDRVLAAGCHVISKPFYEDKFILAIDRIVAGTGELE
jgi:DNA-binding NarL/FixJ family response regulator